MALAFGHDHIVIDRERPKDPAQSVYTQNTAQLKGKPSITTETGYLGVPAEDMIERNVEGAFRLMRWLGMLPGPADLVQHPVPMLELLQREGRVSYRALRRRFDLDEE